MFQGFTDETISFMWGIRFNNRRDWFLEHKPVYEQELYQPMKELAAQVQERLLAEHKKLELNVKVTRIYRDARRVKYGGLYKDHLWFTLRPPVEEWTGLPCFYFEARPEGYSYGMGYWRVTPATMEQYRRRILREPEKLEKLARRLNRQKVFALEGDEYKRSKGEVSPLLQPWFNRKSVGLSAEKEYEENSPFFGPELVDEVAGGFEWLLPYYEYFKALELEPPVE